ncbi:thymosin beta-4-like [Vulpes lagopus]|uniref:thymosin beta-4-like n=1 Tax=Vulpes lagopus TaxID=494514 RepID=UPI000DF693C5|nr:thymosin beta-4-like [Vulpes vulpes]XP_041584097.1 thymosin beta-4-like [Vulpes lagopus]XP_055163345.1 thymosin beta-4-like [Nyctereutes procyonoides]
MEDDYRVLYLELKIVEIEKESQTGLWTLLTLTVFSTSSETTSDKPNLAEIEKFNKPKLKAEMEETNPLFCKETVELEKRTQES